jgi:transposase-like protein
MPFTVSLSMTLGDFIDVLQHNGHAALARRRVTSQDLGPSHQSPSESPPATNSRARPAAHFPLELTRPSPINLPSIPRDGRGRPASLTNARARKIIAAACDGASVPACAAAGGVTPNTLKSWLRRKDHQAFTMFQAHYADAVTYATLATLKVIADGVASAPKHAFEFLASHYTENWSMLLR